VRSEEAPAVAYGYAILTPRAQFLTPSAFSCPFAQTAQNPDILFLMLVRFSSGFIFFGLSSVLILLSSTATAVSAQTTPAEPAPVERSATALRFTSQRLDYWQKKLNLQDWHIAVALTPVSGLRQQTLGNVQWDLEKKTATIHVLDPADYHMPWQPMLLDMEFTVVHELIHLELAPILTDVKRSDANRRQEEFAVNHLAEALLQLDRTH